MTAATRSVRMTIWSMLFRWRADDKAGITPDMAARVDELCALTPTDGEALALEAETKQKDAPSVRTIRRIRALARSLRR